MSASGEGRGGAREREILFIPSSIAVGYLLLHLATASRYGYFRDALYYLACSRHLDWGYVDHPPLAVFVAWLVRQTLGTSLLALILLPALAGAGRILLTAAFARELGAGRFGIALAAGLAAVPGVWWVVDHQLAMNAFEPLFWTACAFVVLRMIRTRNPRLWLAFGAFAGLGLENKYSIVVPAFALLVCLLLTKQRKLLLTPWLLAGGGVALVLFLPNLVWNIVHHWPFLEVMHNIRASGRDVVLSPVAFLAQQALVMNPVTLPIWLTGLAYLLFSREGAPHRVFGWAFVITIAFFLLAHGKNYYAVPAYPPVLAAGALAIERFFGPAAPLLGRPGLRLTLKTAVVIWLLAGVIFFLPVVLPVLPVEAYLRYQTHLLFPMPHSEHSSVGAALPQHYADEFGWPEMVAAAASVYRSLPPEERARAAILTSNFGEAAAIDFFGPRYALPAAICANQSYFLWGPRGYTGDIVIRIGSPIEDVRPAYDSVVIGATLDNPYALDFERRPILLCRGLKENLQSAWPRLKTWD
jgi:hypothetical protein